jgi:aminoglycoside phosphotransferase (APT) family kinase protein
VGEAEQSEVIAAIPLKGSARDLEQTRKRLTQWLAPRLGAGREVSVSPITTPNGTGVANETLLFEASWSSGGKERTERLVARVASERPLYIEADVGVQARIYETLADVPGVPVPRVYGYEADPSFIGAPFFVMERVEGEVPGDQPIWHRAGFVRDASPERRRAMWEDAVRVLAALHQVDAATFSFLSPTDGRSGLADHLAYWRRHIDASAGDSTYDTIEHGYEWLRHHLPQPEPTDFSWGDSRFANIMFRDDRVVAIFDWDTASMSGAMADIAWWRFMDGAGAELAGIGSPDELVTRWQELTGRTVHDLDFYELFTSFRLGCIMVRLFSSMAADGIIPTDMAEQQTRDGLQTLAGQLEALT